MIRIYAVARFQIVPIRFLNEFSQHLPNRCYALELGHGFRLFTLYFAQTRPEVAFADVARLHRYIKVASHSAERLGLENVEFICQDVREIKPRNSRFNATFTLDLQHHLFINDGGEVIGCVAHEWLQPGGTYIIKDVTTQSRVMLILKFQLDILMNLLGSAFYRSGECWVRDFKSFRLADIQRHYLWDVLTHPHILIASRKPM